MQICFTKVFEEQLPILFFSLKIYTLGGAEKFINIFSTLNSYFWNLVCYNSKWVYIWTGHAKG